MYLYEYSFSEKEKQISTGSIAARCMKDAIHKLLSENHNPQASLKITRCSNELIKEELVED